MDVVSHAIVGRLIPHAASASRPARAVAIAGVLGALSPDVDFVLMPVGWDIYLRMHQIGTHSVAGALATGLASAGLVRLFARERRYRTLAAAGVAGALSHLVGDILSGATLRPAWPLADTPVMIPLVAMADPWTIAILIAATAVLWWIPHRARRTAQGGLAALAVFFCVKGALLAAALTQPAGSTALASTTDRLIQARWGSLTEWYVYGRTGDVLTQWQIDVAGSPPQLVLTVRGEDSEAIDASRALDTVRNFLRVHDLGFAVHRDYEHEAGGVVLWSDIRFCWKETAPDAPVQCALWFGGELDAGGTFVEQQVRVGTWIQTRPLGSR